MAREIIDFRDLEYDSAKGVNYVTPYKEQGPAVIDVPGLQRNLSIYNARYQPWVSDGGRRCFDNAMGELSDRRAGSVATAMGSIEEHREDCWCRECSDWSRLMADKMDGEAGSLDEGGHDGWGG